jgi:hypothetical protein
MLGRNAAHQLGEFVQRQRRPGQIVHVAVVGDDLVRIAPMTGERHDDDIILGTGRL